MIFISLSMNKSSTTEKENLIEITPYAFHVATDKKSQSDFTVKKAYQ